MNAISVSNRLVHATIGATVVTCILFAAMSAIVPGSADAASGNVRDDAIVCFCRVAAASRAVGPAPFCQAPEIFRPPGEPSMRAWLVAATAWEPDAVHVSLPRLRPPFAELPFPAMPVFRLPPLPGGGSG